MTDKAAKNTALTCDCLCSPGHAYSTYKLVTIGALNPLKRPQGAALRFPSVRPPVSDNPISRNKKAMP